MPYNCLAPPNALALALACGAAHSDTSNALARGARKEWEVVWERYFGTQTIVVDCDGRFIKRDHYGSLGGYGWEIDHTTPTALGGLDIYANKRPRHWRGNRADGPRINAIANALINNPFVRR